MSFNEMVIALPTGMLIITIAAMTVEHYLRKSIAKDEEEARAQQLSDATTNASGTAGTVSSLAQAAMVTETPILQTTGAQSEPATVVRHPTPDKRAEMFPAATRWLLGAVVLLVLLFAVDTAVWTFAGRPPALAPYHLVDLWWLDFSRMIRAVAVLVLAGLILAAAIFVPWLVGSGLTAAWRRRRHG